MSIYSLKMRASRHENGTQEHVSGAEKILRASELTAQMDALLQRALHHAKGKADFVNLKIEEIQPEDLQYIDALPVSTYEAATADEGRKAMAEGLAEQPEMAQALQQNTRIFCQELRAHGIEANSETAIVPIILHDEELALKAAAALRQKNIYISAIRYPTVAKNHAMLRAALMATHTEDELRHAAKTIAATIKELK